MPDRPETEDFLSRWSRRKRDTGQDAPARVDDPSLTPPEPDSPPAIPDEELTDAELLEKFSLPDPDSMTAGDDFSAFMREVIPDRLRRRALRVLWGSNPVLANLDELIDYGEDYTDAATVMENMPTIYKVGKGAAWKFQEEQARIAEEKAAAEAEEAERRLHNGEPSDDEIAALDDQAEDEPDPDAAETADDSPIADPEADEPDLHVAALEDEAIDPLPPRPRPMRFAFD